MTISKGEPLVQPESVCTLLRGAKTLGLHTAIATTGYLGCRVDDDHLALTDPWLLDLESHVPATYRAATGVDTTPPLITQPAASRHYAEHCVTILITHFVPLPRDTPSFYATTAYPSI